MSKNPEKSVLILGGYGYFGKHIAADLVKNNIPTIIAGRHKDSVTQAVNHLLAQSPTARISGATFDALHDFDKQLSLLQPYLVIHTAGPFQQQDYRIATSCINHAVHYLDLADGREFVANITALNTAAKQANVMVISGASSFPGLSSAIIQQATDEARELTRVDYGITTTQRTPAGLATTRAVLSYAGKRLASTSRDTTPRYGWQNLLRKYLPGCGSRWFCTCDIPDIALFPKQYGIQQLHFRAGLESNLQHFSLWGLSCLVRAGLPISLPRLAPLLHWLAVKFSKFGSGTSALYVDITGTTLTGKPQQWHWQITARENQGQHIPTFTAIILTKKILAGTFNQPGAYPCVGLINVDEFTVMMKEYPIDVRHWVT